MGIVRTTGGQANSDLSAFESTALDLMQID